MSDAEQNPEENPEQGTDQTIEPSQPSSPPPAQSPNVTPTSLWARLFQRRTLAILLIVVGVAIVSVYGLRSLRSYREFQYIHAAGLDRGTARLDAIRPWMTVRYVGVAYAVPEEYIFAQLEIDYNRRNSNATLGELNGEYEMGMSPNGQYPLIVDRVAQAIEDYRANPVPTGLREVRPWMTIRYVASSTGVPEAYLLEKLGVDTSRPENKDITVRPLDHLPPHLHFPGGPEALFDLLEKAIDSYQAENP